ncbi:MAG: bifunctional diguanylate cyclase/phosphodiesterase [Nitrospirae bacterium]|nr:bifunctional diguanylate cyclase/phosphodiesterase [Nitrospirota bacterium]
MKSGVIENIFKRIEDVTLSALESLPFLGALLKRQYRLKSFVCTVVLAVSFLSFALSYFVSSSIFMRAFERHTHNVSEMVSGQVFNAMTQLMEKGWTRAELQKFLDSGMAPGSSLPYTVEIYRGEIVEGQYGRIAQPAMDKDIKKVFETKKSLNVDTGPALATIYPVTADARCFGCHVNAAEGDILGVIAVRQDIRAVVSEATKYFAVLFFLLVPIPFIVAGLVANFLNARIRRSSELFYDQIKNFNKINDLGDIDIGTKNLGFEEYNRILAELQSFIRKIKAVAMDREIFEFELQILEKFIITSEVVRDWKTHVSNLLLEANRIIEVYIMFSIFRMTDDKCRISVFWIYGPSEDVKLKVENMIREHVVKKNILFQGGVETVFVHTVADSTRTLNDFDDNVTHLKTKVLAIENPKIDGVVGVSVERGFRKDAMMSLMIDGILTTLLNVVSSVEALERYTKDLEYYATRDPLTLLYNQRMLWELLGYEVDRSVRHQNKFALLVIDLDNFKLVNDSFGHLFGDRFLVEIANRIKGILRQGDIFSRYGGDEFVAVLPESDREEALLVSNRIRECIAGLEYATTDGIRVRTSVSIGFGVFPEHASTATDLFMFADNMMYKAKGEGKNMVVAPTEKDGVETFRKSADVASMIIRAIEDKSVIPYFQPIMTLNTGKIECVEVLCRIQTDDGIHSAIEFIEVAEKLGLTMRLEQIMIEKAFEEAKLKGYEGYLFINLSPRVIISTDFIPHILALTDKHAIDRTSIVFEITERDTVRNLDILEDFVLALKAEGFKFAIDDFGSGFSSFQYMKKFPIDFVKIEGDFIRSMVEEERDAAFVKIVCILAKELNIETIAECVESHEILAAVRAADIDYAQGHFCGRPSPDLIDTPQ